jgi:hypothetical protein
VIEDILSGRDEVPGDLPEDNIAYVTDQLTNVFGLHPDGTVLALKEMSHLSPDQAAVAGRLRDLLDHYTAGAGGREKNR